MYKNVASDAVLDIMYKNAASGKVLDIVEQNPRASAGAFIRPIDSSHYIGVWNTLNKNRMLLYHFQKV